MNIGKSMKIALAKADKDRTWLSKEMGISYVHVSRLANRKTANGERVRDLAAAFDMPVSEFIALGE